MHLRKLFPLAALVALAAVVLLAGCDTGTNLTTVAEYPYVLFDPTLTVTKISPDGTYDRFLLEVDLNPTSEAEFILGIEEDDDGAEAAGIRVEVSRYFRDIALVNVTDGTIERTLDISGRTSHVYFSSPNTNAHSVNYIVHVQRKATSYHIFDGFDPGDEVIHEFEAQVAITVDETGTLIDSDNLAHSEHNFFVDLPFTLQ
jgi:hypothetical protein